MWNMYWRKRCTCTWVVRAQMVGAQTCFCSIMHLEVLPLAAGWDATCSPLQGNPQQYVAIYTPEWRDSKWSKFFGERKQCDDKVWTQTSEIWNVQLVLTTQLPHLHTCILINQSKMLTLWITPHERQISVRKSEISCNVIYCGYSRSYNGIFSGHSSVKTANIVFLQNFYGDIQQRHTIYYWSW